MNIKKKYIKKLLNIAKELWKFLKSIPTNDPLNQYCVKSCFVVFKLQIIRGYTPLEGTVHQVLLLSDSCSLKDTLSTNWPTKSSVQS